MRNLYAIVSAALVFWIVHIGFILLSMQFQGSYEYREIIDVISAFLASLTAGAIATIVARNKNYLVLVCALLLISLPVALILILIPDGRPASVINFVLMCLTAVYACLRGFQHKWFATSN